MQLLIITYYWPPAGGSGVQRWLKFVKYLTRLGYKIHVLTVSPEKATYPLQDPSLVKEIPSSVVVHYTNTQEPFGIYKKITRKKEVPHSGFANESHPNVIQKIARFVRGNFFIPDARIGWNKYALKKAGELIETYSIKNVIISSPPHSSQLIGIELKKKYTFHWIADMRDPWTDIYYYKDLKPTAKAVEKDKKLEKQVLENADKILVVSPFMKRLFIRKSPEISAGKIAVIPNGYDEEDFQIIPRRNHQTFTIAYTGALSKTYIHQPVIEAIGKFLKEKNAKLELAGKIDTAFLQAFSKEYYNYWGYVRHDESIKLLLNADALLLIIPKSANNEGVLTGKLFEYLAAHKPIIAIGPKNGDAAKIIEKCASGKVFDYTEKENIYQYLLELYNKKNQMNILTAGNENVEQYSRKQLTLQLTKIIDELQ